MKKSLQSCMWDIYKDYKEHKLIGIYSFYSPVLVVTDPDVLRQITVRDFNNFGGGAMEVDMNVDPMMGINPFSTPDLETWKERRGFHVSLLTPSKLKPLPDMMVIIGRNMIDFIKHSNDRAVKVKEISDFLAIDAVASYSYGYEPTAFTDPENAFRKYSRETLFTPESLFAINSAFLFPKVAKLLSYRTVSKDSENFFVSTCKRMLNFREKNPSNRKDFFEHMAKYNKKLLEEGKEECTDIEIAGHCVTVYLDSFFTTSSGLSYFILELSEHPDIQEKLREEIYSAGREMEEFDYDKVNSLAFLQMALSESLRLHPPVPVSARICLKTSEVEGVKIEKGTKVLLPYSAFHQDPQYYPEPEKYNPERYLSEDSLKKGTLFPFGDGPRMCLGHRYATLVIKTAIIYLLLNFKISPDVKKDDKTPDKLFPFDTPDDTTKVIFHPLKN